MKAITGARRIEAAPSTEVHKPHLVAVEPQPRRRTAERVALAVMVASLSVFAVAFVTQILRPAVTTVTSSSDAETTSW